MLVAIEFTRTFIPCNGKACRAPTICSNPKSEDGQGKTGQAIITLPDDEHEQTGTQPQRLLGGYLFALCLYQIAIYRWPGGPPFILDPRAGIAVLLINHFSFDNKVIYPVEWITATWLVFVAAMILFRGKFVKAYLISEIVLAAPNGILHRSPCDSAWRAFRARV